MNNLQKAIKITAQCFKVAKEVMIPGVSEKQIASKMRKCAMCLGADRLAFPPIISVGKSSRRIHPKPTNRKVVKNEFVIVDFGVVYKGARTDVTRTYCIDPDKRHRELYALVKRAQKLAESKIRPGIHCRDVDIFVRKYLKNNSRMKFPYGLGHGIVRRVHERPKISPKSNDVFKTGDIFTLEPGLHSKSTGLRIEDMYLLTRKGLIKLTKDIPGDFYV